jgi:hypothetical protein
MYDAGARMITRGIVTEIINIIDSMEDMEYIDNYKLKVIPYCKPFECDFKNKDDKVFFKIKTSIGYPIQQTINKYNPENVYTLQINNVNNIKLSSTAKQAGTDDIRNKLGKWAGDNAPNIEDLIINGQIEGRTDYRPRFMSTGDGNNAVGYVSFAKFMDKTPLLLLDIGKEDNKLKVFGATYSQQNSQQISQAASASRNDRQNDSNFQKILNDLNKVTNTSKLRSLYIQNKTKQKNKSKFIQFLSKYLNEKPSTSTGKVNFNYENFKAEYNKYIENLTMLNTMHKEGVSARQTAQLARNSGIFMLPGEMKRREDLAALSADNEKIRKNEENGDEAISLHRNLFIKRKGKGIAPMRAWQEENEGVPMNADEGVGDSEVTQQPKFRQMLTRLNSSDLVSKLSKNTKDKIIQHLEQYYQENNDNENNRRKFINGISDIITRNPLRLKIIPEGSSAGVFTGNVPEIQKYLKNNSRKRSKMNVNN